MSEEIKSPQSPYLTTREAAAWLRHQHSALERWRGEGRGPRWSKLGKIVLYRVEDLEAFVAARERRSTREPKEAA